MTAAYHKTDLAGTARLAAPGDLSTSTKLRPIVSVQKKDFTESRPWLGSRIRNRWEGRARAETKDRFIKRGSMLSPSQFSAFAEELEKLSSISIAPGTGGSVLNRAAGAVKRYAGHMSGSTLRGAQAGLREAGKSQAVWEGLSSKIPRFGKELASSVGRTVDARHAVDAARKSRNLAQGGTALAVAAPVAGYGLLKARQTLDRNKMASALLEKQAVSEQEARRHRHDYYVRNRQMLMQRGRAYRQANKAQLARKKRRYNRLVASGARRQRQRINTGGMSFTYAGYK